MHFFDSNATATKFRLFDEHTEEMLPDGGPTVVIGGDAKQSYLMNPNKRVQFGCERLQEALQQLTFHLWNYYVRQSGSQYDPEPFSNLRKELLENPGAKPQPVSGGSAARKRPRVPGEDDLVSMDTSKSRKAQKTSVSHPHPVAGPSAPSSSSRSDAAEATGTGGRPALRSQSTSSHGVRRSTRLQSGTSKKK